MEIPVPVSKEQVDTSPIMSVRCSPGVPAAGDGTYYNMKSAEEHDAAMALWIKDTNDEMEIFASSYEDEAVMTRFWNQMHAA